MLTTNGKCTKGARQGTCYRATPRSRYSDAH